MQLAPVAAKAGIPLLILAAALATAGIGWFMRRLWACRLAVAILITHMLGDLPNFFLGRVLEGTIGIAAVGALLYYIARAPVRAAFQNGRDRVS